MPQIKNRQFENFGDGLLDVCEVDDRIVKRTKLKGIRFGNRTIGVQRFTSAQTIGNKVDKLLSVPLDVLQKENIEALDIIIMQSKENDVGQYKIIQMQQKFDKQPPALYISLEKILHPYKDERKENEEQY